MIIDLPYKYIPRFYQKPMLKAFFIDKIKHFCCVDHRRSGKTVNAVNLMCAAAQMRVGAYYFLLPELKQARRSVWEARGRDGIKFIDYFHPDLVARINNTEMLIEFRNGSIFRLGGSDRYDSLMGSNPLGIIYDEYSLQNPYARDYMVPILTENEGFEIFTFTPRGGNHAFQLYNTVRDLSDWYTQVLTIDDTKREDGSPVITQDRIDRYKKSGWSEDKIQQEFYCSFEAAVTGAYFAKQLQKANTDNRIINYPVDVTRPVYTAWDLGKRDATAIWFFQIYNETIFVIDYYENRNEILSHYVNYVREWGQKNQTVWGRHVVPHDSRNESYTTGHSVLTMGSELGFDFYPLPRIGNKSDHIEMGRFVFSKCIFNKDKCKRGLDCLREYHAKYNEALGIFSVEPEHNWSSHGADAFLYLCQYYKDHHNYNAHITKGAISQYR